MRESTFTILRDLIHQETGLFYADNKKDLLADKLYPRLVEHQFDSFLDYYYFLKYETDNQEEWRQMVNLLSVPETYFWRESDQIEVLVNYLIPQYLEQHSKSLCGSPLTIWSAACATGEEPLSIAIALQEAQLFDRVAIQIYASDLCVNSIKQAQSGIYSKRSFRTLSSYLRQKYFIEVDGKWQVIPEIHRRVKWQIANLYHPTEIRFLSQATFIFCRNVFIYFSEEATKKTVAEFYKNMTTPGYLFVSASESLMQLQTPFELQRIGEAFIYVKQ